MEPPSRKRSREEDEPAQTEAIPASGSSDNQAVAGGANSAAVSQETNKPKAKKQKLLVGGKNVKLEKSIISCSFR